VPERPSKRLETAQNLGAALLDVTMNEDLSRSRKDHGPQNLALLRLWALNACKIEGSNGSIKGKLKRAGWNDDFLDRLPAAAGKSQMR
jgi:hypothetical protein